MLGRYLAEGVAGEPDTTRARSWFEEAAAQGVQEVQANVAALSAATARLATIIPNPALRLRFQYWNFARQRQHRRSVPMSPTDPRLCLSCVHTRAKSRAPRPLHAIPVRDGLSAGKK